MSKNKEKIKTYFFTSPHLPNTHPSAVFIKLCCTDLAVAFSKSYWTARLLLLSILELSVVLSEGVRCSCPLSQLSNKIIFKTSIGFPISKGEGWFSIAA